MRKKLYPEKINKILQMYSFGFEQYKPINTTVATDVHTSSKKLAVVIYARTLCLMKDNTSEQLYFDLLLT